MADFCTITDVKEWLGIPASNINSDPLLSTLISSASSYIENWTNRTFSQTTATVTVNGNGSALMLVKDYPITAISSVMIDNVAIPLSDGSTYGYLFDDETIYLIGYKFTKGFQNVKIGMTYGFATIPTDLKQVCVELVGSKFKEKERIGVSSKTLAGEVITFDIKDIKEHNKSILNNYNRVVPL